MKRLLKRTKGQTNKIMNEIIIRVQHVRMFYSFPQAKVFLQLYQ